ncbi:MAG: bifunctional 5,10-methylenetetrahydrofolate dehydrogenase/5,10-methenyltetrahydrofolate cyclohydrolase [bacterium]|nr:bifunctional 5,10-methylenetetrahydrofolate dehydrogenase/5,10-methenyltetrahydrofolate cyclohydrolase [bacterium]
MATLLGQPVADAILARVREGVAALARPPHLVVVAATDTAASRAYVSRKAAAAETVGMRCTVDDVPARERTTDALAARVAAWSVDPTVDALIVQLPLARDIDAHMVLEAVDSAKDVDGLTAENLAAAYLGTSGHRAATAAACVAILDYYSISIAGKRATIVGRSRLVGLPLAGMLMRRDATVTIAHTKTADLGAACRDAEILVVASGHPGTVTLDMVTPGAIVIDVGWARIGDRVVGDVAPDAATIVGAITPVPGGVGPVTVAMLLANTFDAARAR